MTDPRIEKLANLLVRYCIDVHPGERVLIIGSSAGLPLVTATYREVMCAGGHPLLDWNEEAFTEILFEEGDEEQLRYIHEPVRHIYETYEARINIAGARNTRSLSNVEPQRQRIRREARRELLQTVMQRSAAGEMRWVTTIFPTHAQAQEADMSLREYEAFVYGACHVDKPDPIAEWRQLSKKQQKLVEWLRSKDEVRVTGPHADLTLSIAGRTFINSDGRRNMPSGEIFTGPVEESVNGWVEFTYPAIYAGREVEGIRLRFEEGKVVEASAKKNEAFLLDVLDTDPGARYLGEFAVGTNEGIDRFTKSILFDEKIGGTIHMAVGAGYPETGSQNESAVHWDMICDMRDGGEIWVDGELFYDSGRFSILDGE
ncbi:MAG: aminopeptidase [Candidatus Promineifilaceae bacterium]|nr:aminopeptidase [Candidatus Promineifilaceae bacterium]